MDGRLNGAVADLAEGRAAVSSLGLDSVANGGRLVGGVPTCGREGEALARRGDGQEASHVLRSRSPGARCHWIVRKGLLDILQRQHRLVSVGVSSRLQEQRACCQFRTAGTDSGHVRCGTDACPRPSALLHTPEFLQHQSLCDTRCFLICALRLPFSVNAFPHPS